MSSYLALHDYIGTVSGRPLAIVKGRPFSPDPQDVAVLLRDCPGLFDVAEPLAAADVARLDAEARARLDADARDHTADDAIAAHERAWGSRVCPGRAGMVPPPVGLTAITDVPHTDMLTAVQLDGGEWVVGCQHHMGHLIATGCTPTPPPRMDTTPTEYLAARRYSACCDGEPIAVDAGDRIVLPAYVGEWVNRDSPGTLTTMTDGG
jgi:hypothetical protein